jgi:hypothetical protein
MNNQRTLVPMTGASTSFSVQLLGIRMLDIKRGNPQPPPQSTMIPLPQMKNSLTKVD